MKIDTRFENKHWHNGFYSFRFLIRGPTICGYCTPLPQTSMGVIEEGVHITPTILSVSDSLMLLDISLYGKSYGSVLATDGALMASFVESVRFGLTPYPRLPRLPFSRSCNYSRLLWLVLY